MSDFELQPAKPKPNQRTVAGPHRATARTDTWLTPPYILKALGEFDLDPCAAPEPRPWPTASRHITLPTNGLQIEWHGRVWLNPPYGRATGTWLEKLANHGNGIALIFARTDTDMFFEQVWKRADAVAFLRGRLTFCDAAGRIALATLAAMRSGSSCGSAS